MISALTRLILLLALVLAFATPSLGQGLGERIENAKDTIDAIKDRDDEDTDDDDKDDEDTDDDKDDEDTDEDRDKDDEDTDKDDD